ncbi:MAG: PAS domain S-box protein [Steroidobacteraceae bacterium]
MNTVLDTKLVPTPRQEIPKAEHFVQFYLDEQVLIDSVADYVRKGVNESTGAIVIATQAHIEALAARWRSDGFDVAAARDRRQVVLLDADQTLSTFMVNGVPDREKFFARLGGLIVEARRNAARILLFGEMVALLWTEGHTDAAVRLEQLWNELAREHEFTLFCAYCLRDFAGGHHVKPFEAICASHTHVVPVESYVSLSPKEQQRAIALLQQKAYLLEKKLEHEAAIQTEMARLAAIVESSDDAILSEDIDGRIRTWNAAASRIFGYSADEAVGQPITLIIPADRHEEGLRILDRLKGGERVVQFETTRVASGGRLVEVSITVSPLTDASGAIIGASKIARDITARKQAEARLHGSERALRQAHEELKARAAELLRFNRGAVGRELRIIELKAEVNELLAKGGEDARYSLELDQEEAATALPARPKADGLVPLEAILRTGELQARSGRPPDYEAENRALAALVQALADSPRSILQTLADKVLEVLRAGSSGLSLLTETGERFYWAAIAGAWQPHSGGGTARDFGPCGDVLDHDAPLLFTHWEHRYPYLATATPLAEEGLLVPFHVGGKAVGTIWAITHDPDRRFDGEDLRVLESLGRFASVAYQAVELSGAIDQRRAALSLLEDAVYARQLTEASNRKLRESEERFRNLVSQSIVGIAETDLEGRFTLVNDRYCAMVGYVREELLAMRMQDITHPDDLPRNLERFRSCVQEGEAFEIEKRYVCKDGTVIWVRNNVAPLLGAERTPASLVAISEDITQHRLAEESLREETRVREVLGHLSQALVGAQLDLERVVQIATDAATELSGAAFGAFLYNVRDEQGESYLLFTLSGALREAFGGLPKPRNTRVFGPTFRGEGVVRSADITVDPRYGQNPPFSGMPEGHLPVRSYLAVPLKAASGEVLGGLFFGHPQPDVFTERAERLVLAIAAQAAVAFDNARLHQASQREIEQRKRVEEALSNADRRKDEFLAMLAHELRNPLAPIGNASELLARLFAEDGRAQFALDMIKRQTSQLTRLVDDLLDISRITQGRIQLRKRPVDLASAIMQAVETVEPQMRAKRQRLSVTSATGYEPLYVNGDFARLVQCVVNLLANAAKYTDQDGEIRIRAHAADSTAIIEITDTGVGIAPDLLPRVFDLFVQSDRTLDRAQGGLGIGLSVTKRLIEMHAGEITASSPGLGHGSTFQIRLPRIARPETIRPEAAPIEAPPRQVLIVDDNDDAATSLAALLSVQGHRAEAVRSAKDALARLETFRPDVMLLDIGLPEMNGYELAKRLRSRPELKGLRLIAVTGYGQADDRQRALAAGFDDHLVKPVDLQALERALAGVPADQGRERG